MDTRKKILLMGILLLISGVTAALINFEVSAKLQYVFVAASLAIVGLGIMIGKTAKTPPVPSKYFWWIGFAVTGLSLLVLATAASALTAITILGFFLFILAFVEFGVALQILNNQRQIPWKVVGLKLTLSATAAIGGASLLKTAGLNVFFGLLFLGVLFILVGLAFIQMARSINKTA
jgi:hypothetical protein